MRTIRVSRSPRVANRTPARVILLLRRSAVGHRNAVGRRELSRGRERSRRLLVFLPRVPRNRRKSLTSAKINTNFDRSSYMPPYFVAGRKAKEVSHYFRGNPVVLGKSPRWSGGRRLTFTILKKPAGPGLAQCWPRKSSRSAGRASRRRNSGRRRPAVATRGLILTETESAAGMMR